MEVILSRGKSKTEGTFAQRVAVRRGAALPLLWPAQVGASSGAGTAELHPCGAGSELTCPAAKAYGCGKANRARMQPYHLALIGSSKGLIQFRDVFSKNPK